MIRSFLPAEVNGLQRQRVPVMGSTAIVGQIIGPYATHFSALEVGPLWLAIRELSWQVV